MSTHACGGTLRPAKIAFERTSPTRSFIVAVDGFRCDRCGEEGVSLPAAEELEALADQTPDGRWSLPGEATVPKKRR